MCWAVVAKILKVNGDLGLADFGGGASKEIVISTIDDPHEGDFVLVHAGVALSRIREEELLESLRYYKEIKIELAREGGLDPEEVRREVEADIRRWVGSTRAQEMK